jgi:hypothetical protein
MDIKKSMLMGLDECHISLKEAYADLDDDVFQCFAVEGHNNIATIVTHLLQQHDDFNAVLQRKRGMKVRHEWRFMQHEERFELWGLPKAKLPKPGQSFPTVAETLANHQLIHKALIDNITAIPQEEFISAGVGQWPRLCDMFFRATYHANAHVRQIWFLRGIMGIDKGWPVQHYA